jgi:hypothetical protein
MVTIAYDKPVKDLIAGLNATGHVTHQSYKKTMVTLHHNAAMLSHEGVLDTWKTREASAHFDVDRQGAVAQYVKVEEYAWATGTTRGNQTSISIEMANSSLGGSWPVAETTWREAARLAGWLFAHVIGVRPDSTNLVPHHYWYATACSGPYMDSVWGQVVQAAQQAYDLFTKPAKDSPMKNLVVVKKKGTPEIWVGDGVIRRHVSDETELNGLMYQIGLKGGDPTIYEWEDLRVLGIDAATLVKPV